MNSQPLRSAGLINKNILSLLTLCSTLGAVDRACAFTAYETSSDKLVVSGRVVGTYHWHYNGKDDNKFANGSSVTKVTYTHSFASGWSALFDTEWGYDPFFTHGNIDGYKRDLYAGFSHPTYGQLTLGKQESILYDLIDVYTDLPWLFEDYTELSWLGYDANLQGFWQAPRTLKYSANSGRWKFGTSLGWAMDKTDHQAWTDERGAPIAGAYRSGLERKYLSQVAASYQASPALTLFAGYDYSRLNHYGMNPQGPQRTSANVNAWEMGGNWTPGNWYFAVIGGESRNLRAIDQQSRNTTVYGQYTFTNAFGSWGDLLLHGETAYSKDKTGHNDVKRNILSVTASLFNDALILAVEHMWLDDQVVNAQGRTLDKYAHDTTALLVRYNY